MINKIILSAMMFIGSVASFAQTSYDRDLEGKGDDPNRWNLNVRGGYSIGGTVPFSMPAEMRGINSFSPKLNYRLGFDVERRFNDSWGVQASLYIDRKGFNGDMSVSQYDITIEDEEGNKQEGPFTGSVNTDIVQTGFTIPVQATWWPCKQVKLKAGPYISIITDRKFSGYAYDGYLRDGGPKERKIAFTGDSKGEFSGEEFDKGLRTFQWGFNVGCDYYFAQHWGVFGDLSLGCNSAFKSDFKTITMGLYPLYFTAGITYKFGR